jgi:hypothetical protein
MSGCIDHGSADSGGLILRGRGGYCEKTARKTGCPTRESTGE